MAALKKKHTHFNLDQDQAVLCQVHFDQDIAHTPLIQVWSSCEILSTRYEQYSKEEIEGCGY